MVKKNILIYLFTLITLFGFNLNAQDAIFSQFYSAPLMMNPAFAGNTYRPLIHINYRNQWSSFPTAYSTYALSYDQYFEKAKTGFGLQIVTDDAGAGIYKTNSYSSFFSYRLKLKKDLFIKLGVEAGAIQKSLDWDKLIFYNQIDPITGIDPTENSGEIPPESQSITNLDISSGILLYSPKYYIGFAAKHINTPDDSFLHVNDNLSLGLPLRFTFQTGMHIKLTQSNKKSGGAFISPNALYVKQRSFSQVNIGAYGGLDAFFLGAWYRHTTSNPDAAIISAGYKKEWFKIGYSYDITISKFASERGGSHELALTLNFDTNRPRKIDYNDCFEIFR